MTTKTQGQPTPNTYPIVAMNFRPPAKDVLNLLVGNSELLLQRQPENPHDVNAVQVLLYGFSEEGQHAKVYLAMREAASGSEEALAALQDPLHLGYIANSDKTGGKFADGLVSMMDAAGVTSVPAHLSFSPEGKPMATLNPGALKTADQAKSIQDTRADQKQETTGQTMSSADPTGRERAAEEEASAPTGPGGTDVGKPTDTSRKN